MKKNKILIITLVLGILFLTSYLYNSYATSTSIALGNDENTYDILLNDSTDTVSVPAKSSKTIYYQFSNTNKGTIKYYIGYISNNVIAKVWWDTEDPFYGTIEQGEYKFIKLKLINDSTTDDTITIKPVLGYVNGGDVIPDSNTTLVTGTINETNTMSIKPETALTTLGIDKTTVEEISFVKDNIVPEGALGSTTVSSDNSVILWYTASDTEDMYKVYIGSDNGITSFPAFCRQLFYAFSNLIYADFDNVDTSRVIYMNNMFYGDQKLAKLKIENFNTQNVITMAQMFQNCSKLKYLNVSSFKTSNISDMSQMFSGCSNLTNIDLHNFDTSYVKNMERMFFGCSSLKTLDLSNFNTSLLNSMYRMFYNCRNLTSIDMRNADLSIVTNYTDMLLNVPTSVTFYLKDTQGNRDFMSNNFSTYTNVQYIPSS